MEHNHIRSSMIERTTMEEFFVTLYDEDGNQVAVYYFTNYKDAENCVKKWYEHDWQSKKIRYTEKRRAWGWFRNSLKTLSTSFLKIRFESYVNYYDQEGSRS